MLEALFFFAKGNSQLSYPDHECLCYCTNKCLAVISKTKLEVFGLALTSISATFSLQ